MLTLGILPGALREKSISAIGVFETHFERVGIPALLLQIASGIYLAITLAPPQTWLDGDSPVTRLILVKLALLGTTLALAADARLRIIPNLTPERLLGLAWHILAVTVTSVAFVVVGVGFRFGLLS